MVCSQYSIYDKEGRGASLKKILFTIQWYPSVLSANALCDQKIIDILAEDEEYEITCLAYKPTGAPAKEEIGNVNVVRFYKGYWWNKTTDAKRGTGKHNRLVLALIKPMLRLRQIITIPFYPSTEPIANWKFAHHALKLQRKEHFDIVVSEFHGLDSLHAGSVLKKHYPEIKFVAILWDAFTGKEPCKYLPAKYADRKMEKAEKRELSCADKIVAMESSRRYHEQYSVQKSYYDRFVFLDIPGIVRQPDAVCKSRFIHDGKINIVYAGILNLPDRDPEYIVETLAQTSYAPDIHMIFICTGQGKQKLETLRERFPGEITISGYVEKDALVATYREANVLLNLGGPNPNMVPSKIFEYLSYGKPIISTYYVDGEASLKYFSRYPLAICMDQRKPMKENSVAVDVFLSEKRGHMISYDDVVEQYKNNSPQKYKELLDELI